MFEIKPGRLIVAAGDDAADVAVAAQQYGATALRVFSPEQVAAAKRAASLPVIGSWTQEDGRGQRVVTPTLASARALVEAGADVIALDASAEAHAVPGILAQLIEGIKTGLKRPVLAVVTNVAEGQRAAAYGADLVAAAPRGDDPDLALVSELARAVEQPIVAERVCKGSASARAARQGGAALLVASAGLMGAKSEIKRFIAAVDPPEGEPTAERYWAAAAASIAKVQITQGPPIREAARICARAILSGGVVHIFGAGHSRAFGMELSGRAGGLVPMHVFGLEEVAPPGKRGLELLDLERSPDTARLLLSTFPVKPEDVFLIASNSGRNGCPVELALRVTHHSHPLIAVTSLDHASAVTSRHPSGKKVYELADVVIDNGAPYGDAVLTVPGMQAAVCAVSSATGALIAQALTAEIIRLIREAGEEPPVYISANVDGADEHNRRLEDRYRGRI